MKRQTIILAGLFFLLPYTASAQQVILKSTGQGDVHNSDTPSVSDPYAGKTLTPQDLGGHPLTQQPYTDDCTDDRCVRAKQRQLGNTTWEEDRASGLHKSSTSTKKKKKSSTEAQPTTSTTTTNTSTTTTTTDTAK